MRALPHFVLWCAGLERAGSQTTVRMRATLGRLAAGRTRLVEIGCMHGVNTANLRRSMSAAGTLYAIDPFAPGRLGVSFGKIIAHREVSRIANGRVRWLRMTDLEAARCFESTGEPPVDLVFSDAVNSREGMRATWAAWSDCVEGGGIYVVNSVLGTSSLPIHDAESARYYREVIRHDPRFDLLEEVDNMAVLRRRPS